MKLIDVARTTSFRVGILFLVLFGAGSAVLFGLIYWQTAGYMDRGIDDWLRRESTSIIRQEGPALNALIETRVQRDPQRRRPVGLFEPSGKFITGSLRQFPMPVQFDVPVIYSIPVADGRTTLRAMARETTDGRIIVLSEDVYELSEFEELLTGAMLTGGLLIAGLGLAGAIILGSTASRRVDGVTRAIQNIVDGDLSQRLPDRGAHDDVTRLIRVVNTMLDEIQRLMQEVKGVCDNVAHDLRTPLTRLLAGLERVRRRGGTVDEYAQAVDLAVTELSSVLMTFSAMLRISEIEDGARRSGFVKVDLRRIAEDVLEYYEPAADEKGTTLTILPLPAQPVPMQGDPSLLFEAIGNLVDNALKFTPAGGKVILSLHGEGEQAMIEVADTGPGVAPEIREHVLKRFVRAEASRHTPGNGLGLSMVAAVARLHRMNLSIGGQVGCVVTMRVDPDAASGTST